MSNNNLFFRSLAEHQRLVNILTAMVDDSGNICTSIKELSVLLGKSQSLVQQYIKRINKVDICIETKNGVPISLNYSDLSKNGVFKLLLDCIKKISEDTDSYIQMNHFQKMEFLGVSREIIYMLDAYLLTNNNKGGD